MAAAAAMSVTAAAALTSAAAGVVSHTKPSRASLTKTAARRDSSAADPNASPALSRAEQLKCHGAAQRAAVAAPLSARLLGCRAVGGGDRNQPTSLAGDGEGEQQEPLEQELTNGSGGDHHETVITLETRRSFLTASVFLSAAGGSLFAVPDAQAGKRKPPPPPQPKDDDLKGLGAYEAKLLAKQKRKAEMKAELQQRFEKAKLREEADLAAAKAQSAKMGPAAPAAAPVVAEPQEAPALDTIPVVAEPQEAPALDTTPVVAQPQEALAHETTSVAVTAEPAEPVSQSEQLPEV